MTLLTQTPRPRTLKILMTPLLEVLLGLSRRHSMAMEVLLGLVGRSRPRRCCAATIPSRCCPKHNYTSVTITLIFENFRFFGSFAWERSLGNLRLITFAAYLWGDAEPPT